MNLPIIQFIFKAFFVVGLSLFFVQCQDDTAAREAAQKSALETAKKTVNPLEKRETPQPARPATSGTLTLQASGGTTAKGEKLCVPVTTQDFREIVSMQHSIQWDPAVLQFANVANFGLPALTENNFGGRQAGEGILSFSWFDQNVKGISQPNGHKLYDLCFQVVGEAGSKTKVQFADAPVIIEITNSATQFLDLNGQPAVVKVQ